MLPSTTPRLPQSPDDNNQVTSSSTPSASITTSPKLRWTPLLQFGIIASRRCRREGTDANMAPRTNSWPCKLLRQSPKRERPTRIPSVLPLLRRSIRRCLATAMCSGSRATSRGRRWSRPFQGGRSVPPDRAGSPIPIAYTAPTSTLTSTRSRDRDTPNRQPSPRRPSRSIHGSATAQEF